MENVRESVGRVARNVEVWIFGAFAGLVLAASLDQPAERTTSTRVAAQVGATHESARADELAQPQSGANQPMYVVYVVGKRPSSAEKRAARADAG